MSLARAEIIPAVTVFPKPKGFPIATTQFPTLTPSESPHSTGINGCSGSTFSTAKSVLGSLPTISALRVISSAKVTTTSAAPAITWLLVTIKPSELITNPEPSDLGLGPDSRSCGFSPRFSKNSLKNSSNGEPGGNCGTACPGPI